MSAIAWILLAVVAALVLWVVMRQNDPLPAAGQLAPNGQPYPVAWQNNPQAQGGDQALATSIAGAVGAAFGLAGSIINSSQKK